MSVEVADVIADLDESWPLGGDGLNESDDHHRLTKHVLKNQFKGELGNGLTRPVLCTEDEFDYLVGVTSPIQTQIDSVTGSNAGKADKAIPDNTNNLAMLDAAGNLVDSKVESDGNGNITANVTGNVTGNAGTITGQGALATKSSVGQADINADSVRFSSEMVASNVDGSVTVGASSTVNITDVGVLCFSCVPGNSAGVFVEVWTGAVNGWIKISQIGLYSNTASQAISNGSNIRISNISASSHTVRWNKSFS